MLLTFGMIMDQSYATAISSGQIFMLCGNLNFSTNMASCVEANGIMLVLSNTISLCFILTRLSF